ncbi:MAG TPA: serine/threonine-protein kinase [Kofleriaceae bacterium]|nr:serine/threonine-protein kinase [Kofleriaceae bacterium]
MIRVAAWHSGAVGEEARAHVQARLSLFVKLWFWLFWVLVAALEAAYQAFPAYRPERVDFVFECALVGQLALAATWYFVLHRRRPALETLYFIDALGLVVIGAELGNAAYMQSDLRASPYVSLIWHTIVVFARVVMIPSSGRRTLVVTSLSFVPVLVGPALIPIEHPERIDLPTLVWYVGGVLIAGVVVLVATMGSRVIYGLQRQVREAMQLGQYTLEEKIGEGGMGTVHRARHAMLRRPTAIKLLPPDRYDAASLERFQREVQNMSRLTHPNTVSVFDYGRSLEGVLYYAMEYVDGIDLEALVRSEGPLPAPRVIHILRQICGALDEAHAVGIVHRDIKPANVILCQRGRKPDVVKVVDFGLVKEIARGGDTTDGQIAGTPAYLSPEAITDPDHVGPASDLYSLGALGYFLLTGQRLFEAKTVIAMCTKQAVEPPIPPSQRTTNAVPADLEALILRCLAKKPEERPESAHALRGALAELPAYRDWDELAGLAWWTSFHARRERATRGAPEDAPLLTTTHTRDLEPRTGDTEVEVDVFGRTTRIVITPRSDSR